MHPQKDPQASSALLRSVFRSPVRTSRPSISLYASVAVLESSCVTFIYRGKTMNASRSCPRQTNKECGAALVGIELKDNADLEPLLKRMEQIHSTSACSGPKSSSINIWFDDAQATGRP